MATATRPGARVTDIDTPPRSGALPDPHKPGSLYWTKDWQRFRARIVKRANYRCEWCGADIRGKGKARVDHKTPARNRPDLFFDPDNARALCVSCDAKRHYEKGAAGTAKDKPTIGVDGFPIDNTGDLWRV